MKKFYRFLSGCIVSAALLTAGCTSHEEIEPPHGGETVTLSLSTPTTRTELAEETHVHWSEGDRVRINGHEDYHVTLDPDDPTRATITDVPASDEYVALYCPGAGGFDPDTGVAIVYFTSSPTYTPGSFGTRGGNPMMAYSTTTSLAFKNAGGLLRIGVTGDTAIRSISLASNAGELVAGYFQISRDDLAAGRLDLVPAESFESLQPKAVTIDCMEAVPLDAQTPTYFYFALPVQEYTEGFTVTLTADDGRTCIRQTHNPLTIERSVIKQMEPFVFTADKELAITAEEEDVTATSIGWSVRGNPSTDLRTILITQTMWDHYINGGYDGNSNRLIADILSVFSTTIPTDENGLYEETATQARNVNSMVPIQAETDYRILAAYFVGEQIAGNPAMITVRTPAASGVAPDLNVDVTPVPAGFSDKTAVNFFVTTSGASGILTVLMSENDYTNHFSQTATDPELLAQYGHAQSAETVDKANNGGANITFGPNLSPETDFILLIAAVGEGGMQSEVQRIRCSTAPYLDPGATWEVVATNASFDCGFFYNVLRQSVEITGLTVEKLTDRDLFRLTDAFSTTSIPALAGAYTDLTGGPYYLYLDATDPDNVVVPYVMCRIGLAHIEDGVMSVGNDFNVQGGEQYQYGRYDATAGTIEIGVLASYSYLSSVYITLPSTLYLNPGPKGNSLSTEDFTKDQTSIPW